MTPTGKSYPPSRTARSTDRQIRSVGSQGGGVLYFAKEGVRDDGMHGQDYASGSLFTVLEGPVYDEETTNLAFSPDNRHMYVVYQRNRIL